MIKFSQEPRKIQLLDPDLTCRVLSAAHWTLQRRKKADVLGSSLGTWEINGLSLEIRS